MTFWEYLKYNQPTYTSERHQQLWLDVWKRVAKYNSESYWHLTGHAS
jgi:hypothetical protein